MKEISSGIIIYRKTPHGVKFLILYHGRGYWNFPKGKIESSPSQILAGKDWAGKEKSWEAAVREVREETGLRLSDLRFKKKFKAYEKFVFYRRKEKIFKIVIFYLAEAKKAEVRISKEHEGLRLVHLPRSNENFGQISRQSAGPNPSERFHPPRRAKFLRKLN